MAELRMRIFSNRDKEQTLEELEEQVNEFLTSVYQVERILQSGGDYFTTITVCYWDRPSGGPDTDASLAELEEELSGASLPGGSAGTGETLSHTHELAAQGVRGLAMEEGGLEHAGLDTTDDNLRHSQAEAQFPFASGSPSEGGSENNLGDLIAQSLAEELDDELEGETLPASPLSPAELTWEHACELHRLEDGMLTALEQLTAFRAAHPLGGQDLIDFLLGEESLVQMVEQVRSASEELGSALRAHALRHGFNPPQQAVDQQTEKLEAVEGARGAERGEQTGTARGNVGAAGQDVPQLRAGMAELARRIDEYSRKKNFYVARLKRAHEAQDAGQQESSRKALESLQRILSSLRRQLRVGRERLLNEGADD